MAFLNPERVERQGGQKQLCARSTEKGFLKRNLKRKLKEKSRTHFLELGPFQQGLAGKPKSFQNDQKVRGEGKIFPLSKK